MFKSRSGSQGNASTPPPQSIEAVRRRARHRLIGASVLVLLGVVGFPLLFDTQPRPIPVDIPIEIPAKNPPAAQARPAAPAPATPAPAAPAPAPAPRPAAEGLDPKEEVVEATPPPRPAPAPAAPAPAPAKPPAAPAPSEAARARALLEGKPAPAPAVPAASAERLVVQVGAFAEESSARDVRQKLEAAGLKTYTQVAQTSDGRRIRVRIGPFNSRAEAEKAAARVKSLGLPAAVLTL